MSLLSNVEETLKDHDFGKFQVPSDKIRVNDEPYEILTTVKNKEDAEIFKKEFNKLAKKYFEIEYPLVYRRYIQNGVFYDIFNHRWCILKNGELLEDDTWHKKAVENGNWNKFKKEINAKLGKVYIISEAKN